MPIEIRELVIRAVVEPRGGSLPLPQQSSSEPAPLPEVDSAEIVQACVREVMRILAAEKER